MDITKIVQLRLLKEDFRKISFNENYTTLFLDKQNYLEHLSEFNYISDLMKKDFDWEGIPTESDIHQRFKNNSHCLFWIYDNDPIGWAWSNYNVSPDWKNTTQELKEGEIYGGGAFLSKTIKRPPNSGLIFYNLTFDYWLNELNNNVIYQYSDDWNRVSSIMSYKNGFKKFNFIKERQNAREH
jgi:hypothetical protein